MNLSSTHNTLSAAVLALTLGAGLAQIPAANAQETATAATTCTQPILQVTKGTFHWGIKESWRQYIKGQIALGDWETSKNVTENGDPIGAQFTFAWPVDPANSLILLDSTGKTVSHALVSTQESAATFSGHKGALQSTIISPYVRVNGENTKVGVHYQGFYVPGKGMTDYKPDDRTPKNRVEGKDVFAGTKKNSAQATTWTLGQNTAQLHSQHLVVEPKPGTGYNPDTKKSTVDGVDIIFLGIYNKDYKPEIDDVKLTLEVTPGCLDTANSEIKTLAAGLGQDRLPDEYACAIGTGTKFSPERITMLNNFSMGAYTPAASEPCQAPVPGAGHSSATSSSVPTPGASSSVSDSMSGSTTGSLEEIFKKIRANVSSLLAIIAGVATVAIVGKMIMDLVKPFLPKQ
ncbi:HtaA domain-containing protein [Corynebacterium felinum]|uniref:Htaa domain-containing protein n=1 Tax=Corynebacterium felinum TaxID=131318 RepID=A0ABU2B868_9CORY|nr:HtaA domain-containing protein [Corynebacterium felinum]MDF5821305.1 HtaA domain-containing protein [Corynebacterium felinum]MDR7354812.1 hypothetical protein [Corynebacterium felinum]WJY94172.1 Htaa [Corynebacterium felinum]